MPKPNSDCRATERKHPWPMVRLGDVCEVISSRGHQIKQSEILPSGKYPVVSQSENPIEGFSDKEICIADVPIVLFGDHTCNVKLINDPFVVGADGTKLIKPNRHCMQYLYYCLQLLVLKLQDGKYRRHFGDLCDSEIPLPPLSVQREIVARLERELAAVEKMKKGFEALAETAKAEFKAELKEVFEEISRGGAKTRRLGDAFRFVDYRGMTPNKIASGVPLITAKNIRFGYMDYRERFYISEEDYAKRQTRGVARCGDILFTTEAPMGYVALADQKRFSTGQRIITFQWPNATEHNNRYFLYYFMSDVFQDQVRENASGATAQGIKSSRLVNLSVLIPECQKQSQVVARLDSAKARADKLEAKAREGVVVCETMRKAILKEAFSPFAEATEDKE